ncbi:hypothetical protein F7R06_30060 [Pseudomonas moorei]|nr:hypothetical protein F7R06_30060 [Pseudomonas moorei]
MLYPIELLRHKLAARTREARDGMHVNGQPCLCHVVLRHFKCRQMPPLDRELTATPKSPSA